MSSVVAAAEPSVAMDVRPGSAPRRWLWVQRVLAVPLALLIFALAYRLYTRGNDFPVHFHPDERKKAEQVITENRNFNHPMLLLEATKWAADRYGGTVLAPVDDAEEPSFSFSGPRRSYASPQQVYETARWGRRVSAFFAAAGVAALAMVGYQFGGLMGLMVSGAAVAFCPSLMVYAHYMKEDASLVGGLCLSVLASALVWMYPNPLLRVGSLVFLGLAAGIAVSAKAAGIYVLLMVLPLLLIARPVRWWAPALRVGLVFTITAWVFLKVNHRAFEDADTFRMAWASFEEEREHSQTHHWGLTMKRPNGFFVDAVKAEMMPHVSLLAIAFLPILVASWRQANLWGYWIVLFTGGFLWLVSYSVIPQHRYVLPVIVLGHLLMALSILQLSTLLGRRWMLHYIVPLLFLVFVLITQGRRTLEFASYFENDSRYLLRQWITENLPPFTRIATDENAGQQGRMPPRLEHLNDGFRIYLSNAKHAPALGSLDSIRNNRRIQYVAIADASYERFFNSHVVPYDGEGSRGEDYAEQFERYRAFYDELLHSGQHDLVWESPPAFPTYAFTNPHIRVYRLK